MRHVTYFELLGLPVLKSRTIELLHSNMQDSGD
jgi:hypothetical protein